MCDSTWLRQGEWLGNRAGAAGGGRGAAGASRGQSFSPGDGCTAIQVQLMLQKFTLKMIK